jgi:hypothetical protein
MPRSIASAIRLGWTTPITESDLAALKIRLDLERMRVDTVRRMDCNGLGRMEDSP